LAYLEEVWLTLPEKTLGSIVATLSNLLTPFNYPPFDQLMAGRSTLSLSDCIDRGKVLYVHFPIARRRMMAQTVGTLLKVEYGRQVLIRTHKPRPSFFFCDEFQVFLTTEKETNDADFFERSRGSNHANIIATQNRPAMLKRSDEEHSVDTLLGNCATKIFLRNTDPETNTWGSELFGEQIETLVSTGRVAGTLDPRHTGASTAVSSSASYAPVVKPEEFIRLAQPSAKDGIDYAEAIVHLAAPHSGGCSRKAWRRAWLESPTLPRPSAGTNSWKTVRSKIVCANGKTASSASAPRNSRNAKPKSAKARRGSAAVPRRASGRHLADRTRSRFHRGSRVVSDRAAQLHGSRCINSS
jgi:Type IV secretion-system coupling protein DNA-binding domain